MYSVVGQWFAGLCQKAGDVYIGVINLLGAVIGK